MINLSFINFSFMIIYHHYKLTEGDFMEKTIDIFIGGSTDKNISEQYYSTAIELGKIKNMINQLSF